jgi:riboflavin biosynthesis pyrimidine reductase
MDHPVKRAPARQPLHLRRLLPPGAPVAVEQIVEELGLTELAERMSPTQAGGPPTQIDRSPTQTGRPAAHTGPPAAHTDRPAAHTDTPAAHTDTPAAQTGAPSAQTGHPDPNRPYLVLNMVSTADGRATVEGRSGPIGNVADRQLFHGLRTAVDAVMAGAGTIRVERYRRLVREESARQIRRERGLAEEPWACIVSGRLALPDDIPLLADPAARVAILTSSAASLPDGEGAEIQYIRRTRDGLLDLPAALAELRERLGVRTVLCEGGPHTNSQLLADGLVDELFLSLSPKLAGGDPTGEALRIVSGPQLDPPIELELLCAFEHESHLFLRYRVSRPQAPGLSSSAGREPISSAGARNELS